jgi:thiamine-phosphate pyrophosphorylase
VNLPPLLLLTDRTQLHAGRSLESTIRDCAAAGLAAVVLRELDLAEPERADLAEDLARHVTVISARTLLPAAAGVHLAAHQPVNAAGHGRTCHGRSCHGRSCHDEPELLDAVSGGAEWVTLSPVAASGSKPGYGPALGLDGFRSLLTAAGAVPVYALGGIDATNAAAFLRAGAYGVAVMGAVMRANDPAAVIDGLLEAVS